MLANADHAPGFRPARTLILEARQFNTIVQAPPAGLIDQGALQGRMQRERHDVVQTPCFQGLQKAVTAKAGISTQKRDTFIAQSIERAIVYIY